MFMLAFIASGASDWVLSNVIGVEAGLLPPIRTVLYLMAAAPFLAAFVELYAGIALNRGQTPLVGIGKGLDLALIVLSVFGLSSLLPALEANVGPLGFALGLLANYAFLKRTVREPTLEESPDVG